MIHSAESFLLSIPNSFSGQPLTFDTHYYASSIDDIELCSQAIRGHWSVENNLHWHLDYILGEDENTTIDKTAFNNLSLINKMVLSLCKLTRPLMKKGTSIRSMRSRSHS